MSTFRGLGSGLDCCHGFCAPTVGDNREGFLEELRSGFGGPVIPGCELTQGGAVAEGAVISHFPVVFTLCSSALALEFPMVEELWGQNTSSKGGRTWWEERFHVPS